MEKVFSWGKIFLCLILALLFSSFITAYVFYAQTPSLRPSFQEKAADFPKNTQKSLKRAWQQAGIKIGQLANLLRKRRPVAAIPTLPPPWMPPEFNPPQPTSRFFPTTSNPTPTTYNPPAAPTSRQPTSVQPTISQPTISQPTISQPTATPLPPAGSLTAQEQETVDLINQRRREISLGVLTVNFQLVEAARKQSRDIGEHNFCGHAGSDGSDPFTRARAAGYNGRVYGETVGCGYQSARAVVDGWWGSAGHKAILTNGSITVIGIGWYTSPYRQTAIVGY